jgi:hypothetical protein
MEFKEDMELFHIPNRIDLKVVYVVLAFLGFMGGFISGIYY